MSAEAARRTVAVAITGASGAIYATRTLAALLERGCHIELVISDYGRRLLRDELGEAAAVDKLADYLASQYGDVIRNGTFTLHSNRDLGAKIASGSQDCEAMVVVPCSMKTLAGIANGLSRNLVERAADVMLKERRRLIIVPRETPMSLPQLRNMTLCAEAGAMILPAMPAFYQMPKTLDDLADFMAGKILAALGFRHDLYPAWKAEASGASEAFPPTPTMTPLDKTPSRISGMFDAIAPRYDLLNRVLSAGLDQRWRRRAVEALALPAGAAVLDLCTGTADLAIAIATRHRDASVAGVDFSGAMLGFGQKKIHGAELAGRIRLVRGDAARIPLMDASCDAATIAFGIRNVAEPERALAELARVLRPGARLAILEFGQPRIPGIRTLYSWYFRYLLPAVGRLVSHHQSAYSYLPASVGDFPPPAEFARTIERHHFVSVKAAPLTLGIVYLYSRYATSRSVVSR